MATYVDDHSSIRITRFLMRTLGMWKVDKRRDQLISSSVLTYAVLNLIFGMIVQLMDLFYSWGNLAEVSYNAPCSTSTSQEFSKLLLFVYHRRKVIEFNTYTENTFWKIRYHKLDLAILENSNKVCMWAYGASFCLMQTIAWYYMSIPIIENLSRNETDRELPFRIWFDLPLTKSPWFEAAFVVEAVTTCWVGICSTTFAVFLFTINLYAAGQFRILQRRLELTAADTSKDLDVTLGKSVRLDDDYFYGNLKECLRQHQLLIRYMDRVEDLYCYIMLGQALGGVLQICFSSFQIVLGAEVSPQRTGLSVIFLVGSTIQLFLFSWSCHIIIDQSLAVAEAAYRASWYSLSSTATGQAYRKAILMMICRAHKPCVLTVGKFSPMSLNTFTAVFNTSISYFTVLRKMKEES